jgi:transmembrane sensor
MNLFNFSVDDFVLHEDFQKWVLEPDGEIQSFWENWILEHPEKQALLAEARSLVIAMHQAMEAKTTAPFNEVWQNITATISAMEDESSINKLKEPQRTS